MTVRIYYQKSESVVYTVDLVIHIPSLIYGPGHPVLG